MKRFVVSLTKEKFRQILYYAKRAEENMQKLDEIFGQFSGLEVADRIGGEGAIYFIMQFNWIYLENGDGDDFWDEMRDANVRIDYLVEKYWPGFEDIGRIDEDWGNE